MDNAIPPNIGFPTGLEIPLEIIFGEIKEGKTYVATEEAVTEYLRKGKLVISNYPIYDRKSGRSSMQWDDKFFGMAVRNALIILDEAYRTIHGLEGKDYEDFTPEMKAFIVACAHNGNRIIFIAHHFMRYSPTIREATNKFTWVRKCFTPWPFPKRPWYVEMRVSVTKGGKTALKQAQSSVRPGFFQCEHRWFKKDIFECYNCHQFAELGEEPEYTPWVLDLRPVEKSRKELISERLEGLYLRIKGVFEDIRKGFVKIFKKNGNFAYITWLTALTVSGYLLIVCVIYSL